MDSWIIYVIIAVVLVLMVVFTIIPQKKRQKQQQQMMNSLTVGTKIMTIGRMVGKITQVNADNTLYVNVGTEDNPTIIVIDRNAVGLVLENVSTPIVESTTPAEDTSEQTQEEEVFDQSAQFVVPDEQKEDQNENTEEK